MPFTGLYISENPEIPYPPLARWVWESAAGITSSTRVYIINFAIPS